MSFLQGYYYCPFLWCFPLIVSNAITHLQEGLVKYKRESGWLFVVLRRDDSDSWATNQTGKRTRWDGWKILPQAWGKREPTNPHIHNVIVYDYGNIVEVQQKMKPK